MYYHMLVMTVMVTSILAIVASSSKAFAAQDTGKHQRLTHCPGLVQTALAGRQ